MQHYRNLLLPAYLEPFEDMGENDDLTGPSRLDQDGTSYIRVPGPNLGFFKLSTAHDPRPILVHEGVPGHYFQLCLGWHNADPIRRHYYDSGANEGLGFYAEEMMLQAGFFDDNPHTRETIYSFMRLRALRVEVDVKLALGEFSLQQGADYLARTVPMDQATALDEAAMFSSTPGQGISYQIGKLQITQLLSDARRIRARIFPCCSSTTLSGTTAMCPSHCSVGKCFRMRAKCPDQTGEALCGAAIEWPPTRRVRQYHTTSANVYYPHGRNPDSPQNEGQKVPLGDVSVVPWILGHGVVVQAPGIHLP